MNNNIISNNDFVFCPYNHQYSSSRPPPHQLFRPASSSSSSSFSEFFTGAPTPGQSDFDLLESSSHPFFRHHLPSPYTQFEFEPEILSVFFQHDHDHDHDHRDGEIVLDHHHQPSLDSPLNSNTIQDYSVGASGTINYMEDSQRNSGSQEHQQLSNKRSSKRDRHSKITTAKGLRDRRMRLSLEVARDFFGLQDMLGFDKASKTVEWLLTQAKSEIKKLARSFPHKVNHSFCSDSSIETSVDDLSRSGSIEETGKSNSSKVIKPRKEKKPRSQSRKPGFRIVPKDLRVKARERAKERAKEKMMMKRRSPEVLVKVNNNNSNYEQEGTSNWSSFETGEDSIARSHNDNNNHNNLSFQEMKELSTNHQSAACNNMGMNQEHIADESLAAINKWSPFSVLNSSILSHHNHGATSAEHQFTDVQMLGKPWEFGYNAQNMF